MGDVRREQQRGGRPPGTKPTRVVARAIIERDAARAVEYDVWEGGQPPRVLLSFPWRPPDAVLPFGSLPLYWS